MFRVAWPEPGTSDAWLALDRNDNGKIDDFSELFGDLTPQPEPPSGQQRNGFLALAVYDLPGNGGNGDGRISESDAIYTKLRVWQDRNHDGVSQPEELLTLEEAGIKSIRLSYTISTFVDKYGNAFRYRGSIKDLAGSDTAKIIYDVIVRLGASQNPSSSFTSLRSIESLRIKKEVEGLEK